MKATVVPKPQPVAPTCTIPDDLFKHGFNSGCKRVSICVEGGMNWSGYAVLVSDTEHGAAGSLIYVPSITPERLVHG